MLTLLSGPVTNILQGGKLVALIAGIAMAVGAWMKQRPASQHAENEAMQISSKEAELIRTDYAQQIRDFRLEVHDYRNELHAVVLRLSTSEAQSKRRGDKLTMMAFVLRLVMTELRRLDPGNQIIDQAEALLGQILAEDDPAKSQTLNAAEHAVKAAETTVAEVKRSEGNGKLDDEDKKG